MTIRFTPIDAGTPQEAVAERLARLLVEKGVTDTAALSTAIDILVGIQAAIDIGDPLWAACVWNVRGKQRKAALRGLRGQNHVP